jgi:hypothetical protein
MSVTYCEQWSRHYSYPHTPLTQEQARKRHEKGKLYTALVGDPARPCCFLEFSEFRSVCVEFLDGWLRSIRAYSFQEKRPGDLFLSAATLRQFAAGAANPHWGDIYYFDEDGRMVIHRAEITPKATTIVSREETTTDVSHNWEPFPEFGQYQGLAAFDRGMPALRAEQGSL